MKKLVSFAAVGLAALGLKAGSAALLWTNRPGGSWSEGGNGSSNPAPGSTDDAVITNGATFLVTLDPTSTVNRLTAGGAGGQQLLTMGAKI